MYCTLCVYSIYRRTVQHRRPSCRIISDNNVHIFPYRMEQTNVSKKHGQSHRNGRRILLTIELLIYKYKLWNKVLLWICPKVFVVHSNVSSTSWNRTFNRCGKRHILQHQIQPVRHLYPCKWRKHVKKSSMESLYDVRTSAWFVVAVGVVYGNTLARSSSSSKK